MWLCWFGKPNPTYYPQKWGSSMCPNSPAWGKNSGLFLGNFWLQDGRSLCTVIISRQILLTWETHLRFCLCVCCFYEKVHMPFRFCYFQRVDDLRNRMKSWHRRLFSWPAVSSRCRLVEGLQLVTLYWGNLMSFIAKALGQLMTALNLGREKRRLCTWQVLIIHQCPFTSWSISKRQYGNFCMQLKFMRLPAWMCVCVPVWSGTRISSTILSKNPVSPVG